MWNGRSVWQWIKRHGIWLAITAWSVDYLWRTRPQDVAVLQYKCTLLFLAAIGSYWIRRFLIDTFRLETHPRDTVAAALIVAQAIIFFGAAKALTGI